MTITGWVCAILGVLLLIGTCVAAAGHPMIRGPEATFRVFALMLMCYFFFQAGWLLRPDTKK